MQPEEYSADANRIIEDWQRRIATTRRRVATLSRSRTRGRLTRASGLILEAVGLSLPLGANCWIEQIDGGSRTEAEVVGFNRDNLLLMPFVETRGLVPGARVWPVLGPPGSRAGSGKQVPVGESLLGRVLDARGRPLDARGPLMHAEHASLTGPKINPLQRAPIEDVLNVGIRAINALLTVGRGQRLGLLASSGVGKSVLLGMMARFTQADIIVVGLIGERGREVADFIDNILGSGGLQRAVVVAAPADTSPLLRLQGADYASRLAEDFRDRGYNVLLIMDSLTRYALAQREIALAVGEPPATKGFPPSVFAKLPTLVERAGNAARGGGSITAFYTVLTEGDQTQDPIAEAARAILDGHLVLSRRLADAGHYPAIDIEASISRAMTALIDEPHFANVQYFKNMFVRYERNRDLINVGAYTAGNDPMLDQAIALYPQMEAFLQQGMNEHSDHESARRALDALLSEHEPQPEPRPESLSP